MSFKPEEAVEIASWINIIYEAKPAFLSGKKANIVKACIAYVGGRVFCKPRSLTQSKITHFYNLNWPNTIQTSFKAYLKILQQAKPDIFHLKSDFRSKERFETKNPQQKADN